MIAELAKKKTRPIEEGSGETWPPLGEPKEYGSDEKLHQEIYEYIRTYNDLGDPYIYHTLACFVKETYLYEKFWTAPYVAFIGDVETGKTEALRTLSLLCKKGMHRIHPSPAILFRVVDKDHPTLLLDDIHLTSPRDLPAILQILNSGYKQGIGVDRIANYRSKDWVALHFEPFCPKVFASNEEFVRSLTTRCIQIYTAKTTRDLPRPLDREWAFDLRRKLLRYAQKHQNHPLPDYSKAKHFKSDRLNEVFYPLFSLADIEAAKKALIQIGNALDAERGFDFESELNRKVANIVAKLTGENPRDGLKLRQVQSELERCGDIYGDTSDKKLGILLKSLGCIGRREGHGERERYYMLPPQRRAYLIHRYSIKSGAS